MTKLPKFQRLRALWPNNKRPSSTTDDIPSPTHPYTDGTRPRLTRHATDPASESTRILPLSVSPSSPSPSANAAMTSKATVTFSRPGVQPPVYVVTSLSGWTTLEMSVDDERTASGDFVFKKEFSNVAEGSYQYKIRIGEGLWVVDESKETATDEHGNCNNVIHVKPTSDAGSTFSTSDATSNSGVTPDVGKQKTSLESIDERKDSSIDPSHLSQLSTIPVPFVVVEKVADKKQPEYGDIEPDQLPLDAAKRTSDAEPDFEEVRVDHPIEDDSSKPPEVPLLVVEKTDDKPAYGDDFGDKATSSQKLAHDIRAADAPPDRLIISPDSHVKDDIEDNQMAPLLRHESFQIDDPPPAPSMDTIDEESVHSSTDQTSSSDAINTPSEQDESQDGDELNHGTLLSHETRFDDMNGELQIGPMLSHETGLEEDDVDELDNGPLLSHETGLYDEDEFDLAPLLSHETGFSDFKGSEIVTISNSSDYEEELEPQHYGPYDEDGEDYEDKSLELDRAPTFEYENDDTYERDYDEGYEAKTPELDRAPTFSHEIGEDFEDYDGRVHGDYINTPVLPHERDGSEQSVDDMHYMLPGRPSLGYENDNAKELFGGSGRPTFFRTRTNSSTLPHKLPRSDAEDENLNDPSLERFPTSREQILERVASISVQLPADETVEDSLHSPQLSVMSQACSSVDLIPVKSHTSLASVPEADDSDEEENNDSGDSLPSPMLISGGRSSIGFTRNPRTTPLSGAIQRPEPIKEEVHAASAPNIETIEFGGAGKTDEARERSKSESTLRENITPSAKVVNYVSSDTKSKTDDKGSVSHQPESQLRQRRELKDDSSPVSQPPPPTKPQDAGPEDKTRRAAISTLDQQTGKRNATVFQNLISVVFGSVGRFLTACAGDWKRARTTVLVVGITVAAYYMMSLAS